MPLLLCPRVVIVAASLDILGGQGVQARTLVAALRRDGVPVTLLPINPSFPTGLRWVRRWPYLRTLVNQAFYLPSLVKLRQADVVHAFSASYVSFLLATVPAMVVGQLMRRRVILHYHSGEADDHLTHWGVLVHPWLKLADEIVVPSEYLARVFSSHGYEVRVIPNVVSLSRFEYRDRSPLRPRLLSTRNLEPYYRVDVILEAFALLRVRLPDATLIVAGLGSEESRLKGMASEGVKFVGRVEPAEMPYLYGFADIFVNASVVDNQPVSILEAFASGLPVVSTPTGDIGALVRHGQTGLLVPQNDPQALADAVMRLIGRPIEAVDMARAARREVRRFTWAAVRRRWRAVYSRRDQPPAARVQAVRFDHAQPSHRAGRRPSA
jgi:glycosyltransferase involved in cell wall biosynthesis